MKHRSAVGGSTGMSLARSGGGTRRSSSRGRSAQDARDAMMSTSVAAARVRGRLAKQGLGHGSPNSKDMPIEYHRHV